MLVEVALVCFSGYFLGRIQTLMNKKPPEKVPVVIELTPINRLAILITSFPSERSFVFLQLVAPSMVHEITSSLVKLPEIPQDVRALVVGEFVDQLIPGPQSWSDRLDQIHLLCTPVQVVETMARLYKIDSSLLTLDRQVSWETPRPPVPFAVSQWSSRQQLAILIMSIPPEIGASICKELEPHEVQSIVTEIHKLPNLEAGDRDLLLAHFVDSLAPGFEAPLTRLQRCAPRQLVDAAVQLYRSNPD